MAVAVWEGVNLRNLVEHIAPTRSAADVVLTKGEGHRFS
jgi:DMSO/TMAO reductase YedYZ molybdopterin-dependent catalytic subunit